MIRIEYPKNRQRLKDRYVAAFASYKKLEKMQEKWDELRDINKCLMLFPPRLEAILVAEYAELIRYYNLYLTIPQRAREMMD